MRHLRLDGEKTEWSLALPHEPKEMWLDRYTEVLGYFFNERRQPKRMLFYRALDVGSEGNIEAAVDLCQQALAAELEQGPAIVVVWASWSPRCRDVVPRVNAAWSTSRT